MLVRELIEMLSDCDLESEILIYADCDVQGNSVTIETDEIKDGDFLEKYTILECEFSD